MAEKKDKGAAKVAPKKTDKAAPKAAEAPKAVEAPKAAPAKAAEKPAAAPAAAAAATPAVANERGRRRALVGFVRSDKMDKTVVVEVVSLKRDAVYGKYLKARARYKAHDEKNQYKTGDKVEIREHRPLSREKRWIVARLIEAAKVE
jgi:small subunit ribosomal protein S17